MDIKEALRGIFGRADKRKFIIAEIVSELKKGRLNSVPNLVENLIEGHGNDPYIIEPVNKILNITFDQNFIAGCHLATIIGRASPIDSPLESMATECWALNFPNFRDSYPDNAIIILSDSSGSTLDALQQKPKSTFTMLYLGTALEFIKSSHKPPYDKGSDSKHIGTAIETLSSINAAFENCSYYQSETIDAARELIHVIEKKFGPPYAKKILNHIFYDPRYPHQKDYLRQETARLDQAIKNEGGVEFLPHEEALLALDEIKYENTPQDISTQELH